MSVSAFAVLAALRERAPGLRRKKSQKLLYYCQGHHLASFGRPLFPERISAWDMGPVVGEVWYAEKNGRLPAVALPIDEASLNTVGFVLSRYGALSGDELERLTHSESPWQTADAGRAPGGSEPILQEWLEEYFRARRAADDDEVGLDADATAELLHGAEERRREPAEDDDPAELRERIAAMRERIASRAG